MLGFCMVNMGRGNGNSYMEKLATELDAGCWNFMCRRASECKECSSSKMKVSISAQMAGQSAVYINLYAL